MAFVSHRLTLADDIHSPFLLPSPPHTFPRIFIIHIGDPTSRYLASRCPRLPWEKRERGGCEKERRPHDWKHAAPPRNIRELVSSPLLPRDYLTVGPIGNGIRVRGAHRKRGEQWELSFITGPPRAQWDEIALQRGSGFIISTAVRAGQGGGRAKGDDMCFLASRGIITLELTANGEKALKKGGRGVCWVPRRCPADNGPIISARYDNVCRVTPRRNVRDSVIDHGERNVAVFGKKSSAENRFRAKTLHPKQIKSIKFEGT